MQFLELKLFDAFLFIDLWCLWVFYCYEQVKKVLWCIICIQIVFSALNGVTLHTIYTCYKLSNNHLQQVTWIRNSVGNISRNMDSHKWQSYFVSQQKFILRVIVICHPQVYHYLPDKSKFQLIHRKQHNEKESPHQIFWFIIE